MERIITLQPMLSLSYIGFDKLDTQIWHPVRESNPYRRREREAIYCSLKQLAAGIGLYRTSMPTTRGGP